MLSDNLENLSNRVVRGIAQLTEAEKLDGGAGLPEPLRHVVRDLRDYAVLARALERDLASLRARRPVPVSLNCDVTEMRTHL